MKRKSQKPKKKSDDLLKARMIREIRLVLKVPNIDSEVRLKYNQKLKELV